MKDLLRADGSIGKSQMEQLANLMERLTNQPFTCSMASTAAQEILGGVIMGYWSEDNPTAELGRSEGGHDFLIVEGTILDIWGFMYHGTKLVLDVKKDTVEINKLYGDSKKWERADGR